MDGLFVGLLQVDDPMQASGQILFVRTADANIVNVAICGENITNTRYKVDVLLGLEADFSIGGCEQSVEIAEIFTQDLCI